MKRTYIVFAATLTFCSIEEPRQNAAHAQQTPTFVKSKSVREIKNETVRRVFVKPVSCQFEKCWSRDENGHFHHGTLHIESSNHREIRVSSAPTAVGSSNRSSGESDNGPQTSPDKTTVGWTQGRHVLCTDWSVGGTMFVNSQLVLFRRGKVFRVLDVPNTFIEGWRFWNNGKYVAVGSRWHHGVGYVRLFDVESGKLLERMTTPAAESKGLKWARGLTA